MAATIISEITVNREVFTVGERVALLHGRYYDYGCFATITKINRHGHIKVQGPGGYEYDLDKTGHERGKRYYGVSLAKAAYLEAMNAKRKLDHDVQAAGHAIEQHVDGWRRGHMTRDNIAELRQLILKLELALTAKGE